MNRPLRCIYVHTHSSRRCLTFALTAAREPSAEIAACLTRAAFHAQRATDMKQVPLTEIHSNTNKQLKDAKRDQWPRTTSTTANTPLGRKAAALARPTPCCWRGSRRHGNAQEPGPAGRRPVHGRRRRKGRRARHGQQFFRAEERRRPAARGGDGGIISGTESGRERCS